MSDGEYGERVAQGLGLNYQKLTGDVVAAQ
jgi:hypothetical protein